MNLIFEINETSKPQGDHDQIRTTGGVHESVMKMNITAVTFGPPVLSICVVFCWKLKIKKKKKAVHCASDLKQIHENVARFVFVLFL